MPKVKGKKHFKNKNKKTKTKMKDLVQEKSLPSLSRQKVSSNWLNFIKSSGLKDTSFYNRKLNSEEKIVESRKSKPPVVTKVLSLDCEMVGDTFNQDMLARVSIVNFKLECIYDKYVKPVEKIGDYRTRFSGIRKEDLEDGEDFEIVQKEVRNLLHNKILVGHALFNDFKVLKFGHHRQLMRDTARYIPFKEICSTTSPSLKKLAKVFLNENIQEGEHSSVEDAKTAMKLYKKFRKEWEMTFVDKSCQQNQLQIERDV